MHRALIYSIIFHLVIGFTAWIGVPALLSPPVVLSNNIPVELISMTDTKQNESLLKSNPDIKKKRVTPPVKKSASTRSLSTKIKVPNSPLPKPNLKAKLRAKEKPKKARRIPPQPKRKPDFDNRPKKKISSKEDALTLILKNLALAKKAAKRSSQSEEIVKSKNSNARKKNLFAIDRSGKSKELALAVKSQLTPCWNIPAGAKEVQNIQVVLRIKLNPDGSLRTLPNVLDGSRMKKDFFYRAVAESAVRALQHPRCMPLRLPLAQYNLWKDITLNFDPSEALGQ